MAITIKQLIDKNKSAYDAAFFIESINLSYVLIKGTPRLISQISNKHILINNIINSFTIKYIENNIIIYIYNDTNYAIGNYCIYDRYIFLRKMFRP
jgi:hypothetical protein